MSAIHLLEAPRISGRPVSTSVLQSVRAQGTVQGLLFELSVEQCYLNASDDNIEAVYTCTPARSADVIPVIADLAEAANDCAKLPFFILPTSNRLSDV